MSIEKRIALEIKDMEPCARNSAARYVNKYFVLYDKMLDYRKGSKQYKYYDRLTTYYLMHYYRLDFIYGPEKRKSSNRARLNTYRLELGLKLISLSDVMIG